jgi:nitroreductase
MRRSACATPSRRWSGCRRLHAGRQQERPEIEQKLCAGNVAYNILLGAYALGFGAQWLTGWAAYDREVAAILELANTNM